MIEIQLNLGGEIPHVLHLCRNMKRTLPVSVDTAVVRFLNYKVYKNAGLYKIVISSRKI